MRMAALSKLWFGAISRTMATLVKASWADAGSSSDEDNHSDVEEMAEVEAVPQPAPQEHREPAPRAPVELPTRGPFVVRYPCSWYCA